MNRHSVIRRYLQYLWFRAVHYRRIIDYIGAIEGSEHYQYIRDECGDEYERMCQAMPSCLRQAGFDVVFRNLIISPVFYYKIYDILRHRRDPVMSQRIDQKMKGTIFYLLINVIRAWAIKLPIEIKGGIANVLRRVKWHNKGVSLEVVRELVNRLDVDCMMVSNKFATILSLYHSEIYRHLCDHGLKPLFIFFGKEYVVEKKDNGYHIQIPFYASFSPNYSTEDRALHREAIKCASRLKVPWLVKKKIVSAIRYYFPYYIYIRNIAEEILRQQKAKCLLTFAENQIDLRVFIHEAKKQKVPTLLYYPVDGVHLLNYNQYFSDIVLVPNKIQHQNFIDIGHSQNRCHVVGSFHFSGQPDAMPKKQRYGDFHGKTVLYFTKGTKNIDEGIVEELTEKLQTLGICYRLIIKKHPKDINSYKRFQGKDILVTDEVEYMDIVEQSDLVISQYSGVVRRVIPLRKPVILYTYSDILEYGERKYFQNADLPNYLKYVQNKQAFHGAIELLLNIGEPESLPPKMAEDLYGFADTNCGHRIANIVSSFVNKNLENNQMTKTVIQ